VKRALVISDRDNVATALQALEPGTSLEAGGRGVLVRESIPPGHKIALIDISRGQPIVKYGSSIGHATGDIAAGEHVHTHNVASDRGRGDLHRAVSDSGARLAEPDQGPLEESESRVPRAGIEGPPEESESSSAAGRASGGGAPRAGNKR